MALSFVSLANGCRLCLKIGSDNLDIFSSEMQKKSLLQKIWKYFSIQVLMEDFFPKKICLRCFGEIERFTAYSAEVEKVQKRMQNMIACIPPDFHRNIAAQKNVPDLTNDPIKVEDKPHIVDKPLGATENRKPVAYGILQTQPNNPNPVMSLLIMGDDPANNSMVQSDPLSFITASDNGAKNKINKTDVEPQMHNPNPLLPLLLSANNSGVQSTKANNATIQTQAQKQNQTLPLLVTGGNLGVQNNRVNANVQMPILNPSSILPLIVNGNNPGVPNNTVNMQTQCANSNQVIPLLASGSSLTVQNNINLQTSVLNPSPVTPLLVTGATSGVQNNTGIQTQFLNPNHNKLPLLPLSSNKNKVKKTTKKPSQILPLLLSAGNSSVQNKQVNNVNQQQVQYLVTNPVPPWMVIGPNVQNTNVNNTTQFVNSNSVPPFLVINGDVNVQNYQSNTVALPQLLNPAEKTFLVVGGNPEVQNEKISSTDTELASEDSQCSKECSSQNMTASISNVSKTDMPVDESNNECQPIEENVEDLTSLPEDAADAYCSPRDEELATFYNFCCFFCEEGETFKKYALMDKHCLDEHGKNAVILCCNKELVGESALVCHMKKHKRRVKLSTPYAVVNHQLYFHQRIHKAMCHICPKTFSTQSALNIHLTSHYSKPESEKCLVCGKMLKNKMTLRTHMLLHSSNKKYPCPHCDKVCRFPNRLREHLRCHQDLWPHQCTFCKKLFKRKAGLQAHIVVHTGEQPYQCPYCPRTFASKSNFYSHKLRMHIRRNENQKPDGTDMKKIDIVDKTNREKTNISKRKNGDVKHKEKNSTASDENDEEDSERDDNVICNKNMEVDAAECNADILADEDVLSTTGNIIDALADDALSTTGNIIDTLADEDALSATGNIIDALADEDVLSTTGNIIDTLADEDALSTTGNIIDTLADEDALSTTGNIIDTLTDENISEEVQNEVKSENGNKVENYGVADGEMDLADLKKYYTRDGNEYEIGDLNKYEMEVEEAEYDAADLNKCDDEG